VAGCDRTLEAHRAQIGSAPLEDVRAVVGATDCVHNRVGHDLTGDRADEVRRRLAVAVAAAVGLGRAERTKRAQSWFKS
jgi:hypothetical protein